MHKNPAPQATTARVSDPEQDARIRKLDRLSRLLDTAFRIPGTNFRFGIDAIIGLIPGAGDLFGLALSGYIVVQAARMGVPAGMLGRMISNVAVESLAGTVPVVGDLVDVAWKANIRNLNLLYEHLGAAPRRKPSRVRTAVTAGVLIGILALIAVAAYFLVRTLITALQ